MFRKKLSSSICKSTGHKVVEQNEQEPQNKKDSGTNFSCKRNLVFFKLNFFMLYFASIGFVEVLCFGLFVCFRGFL